MPLPSPNMMMTNPLLIHYIIWLHPSLPSHIPNPESLTTQLLQHWSLNHCLIMTWRAHLCQCYYTAQGFALSLLQKSRKHIPIMLCFLFMSAILSWVTCGSVNNRTQDLYCKISVAVQRKLEYISTQQISLTKLNMEEIRVILRLNVMENLYILSKS